MRIRFTEHAVDRFIERRMPHASKEQALVEMERLAREGAPTREKTANGDHQLIADGVVFVLKHDRADGIADCPTVMFDARTDTNPLAEEIAEFGVAPNCAVEAPTPRRRRSRRGSRFG
jgi:hypothetical protein